MSSSGMKRRVERGLVLQHAVANVKELPHGSANDDHLRLSPFSEPLAEGLDGRVATQRRDRGEVQRSSEPRTSDF